MAAALLLVGLFARRGVALDGGLAVGGGAVGAFVVGGDGEDAGEKVGHWSFANLLRLGWVVS